MAILKKFIPLALACVLTACLDEFDPKVDSRPVLCMNTLITAGEPIDVSITRSWLYSDAMGERNNKVENATLTIYANGEIKTADYLPQAGDRIKLVAECAGYDKAEAEVTVPQAVPFSAVEWKPVITHLDIIKSDEWAMAGSLSFDIEFRLTVADIPDTDNYYKFSYTARQPEFGPEISYDYRPNPYCYLNPGYFDYESEPIFSEHVGALETVTGSSASGFQFFTDRRFAGKSYTLHIDMESADYIISSPEYDEKLFDCGYLLTLTSVSESYYNWANFTWQMTDGIIGDMSELGFADQIWGYSNVSSGAGVVAAQNKTDRYVSLRDFLHSTITSTLQ